MLLTLSTDSLVVFVDDTGHEKLVKGDPVYGLGGCAIMATDLDRIIREPWRNIRRNITGSPDTPLHASKFGRTATQDQIQAIANFFISQAFARFGAIISSETNLADEMDSVQTIALVLQKRILEIAKWTPFKELHVIFESSERANSLIKQAFQTFNLEENGTPIPVACYFMPKSANDPALEVADFIMHAIGRQARHKLKPNIETDFVPDFKAVFHTVDKRLASFVMINNISINV